MQSQNEKHFKRVHDKYLNPFESFLQANVVSDQDDSSSVWQMLNALQCMKQQQQRISSGQQKQQCLMNIYLDFDDQFGTLESLFIQSQRIDDMIDSEDIPFPRLLILPNKVILKLERESTVTTDILFTRLFSTPLQNQISNHLKNSSRILGKTGIALLINQSLLLNSDSTACILELGFYPKIFDLRNECQTFSEYIKYSVTNTTLQQCVLISGSYLKTYQTISLNNTFKCSEFWYNFATPNEDRSSQPLLMQLIKGKRQDNEKLASIFNYFSVQVLIASTNPMTVYADNPSDWGFSECSINKKSHLKCIKKESVTLKDQQFLEYFSDKVYTAITHIVYSAIALSPFSDDLRQFEILQIDFSYDDVKGGGESSIQLEQIRSFSDRSLYVESGYDASQLRFLKESLSIVTDLLIIRASKYANIIFSAESQKLSDLDLLEQFASVRNDSFSSQLRQSSLLKIIDGGSNLYDKHSCFSDK